MIYTVDMLVPILIIFIALVIAGYIVAESIVMGEGWLRDYRIWRNRKIWNREIDERYKNGSSK